MRITPLDIRRQNFRKTMRGYDADEVEAFLEMIPDEEKLPGEENGDSPMLELTEL